MLHNSLLALLFLPLLLAAAAASRCSKGCNCTESAATCSALPHEPFGEHIFSLKIVNPRAPLLLKDQPFSIRGLKNVNSISIINATILEMDKSAFAAIPLLAQLSITGSNLQAIQDPAAFAAAPSLKALSITNSTLSGFELVSSQSVEELDLSGCKLTEISKNSFVNLPNLSYLNLANNPITKVSPLAFSKLLHLQELILSHNNISQLSPEIFKNNTELDTLDLSNNPFETFDFSIMSDLERLVLRSLQLEHFGEKVNGDMSLLNYLDLSNNSLKLSPNTFSQMDGLEYIDLSNNKLKSLDPYVFKSNCKLHKIILDNNNLTVLPKFLADCESFETYFFSCKNCGLTSLRADTFKHFPAIVLLNLSHNRINGVNLTALQYIPSLIELNLSYNNVSILNPSSFLKLSGLEKLYLTGNPIVNLDVQMFHNSRVLKVLDLSFCALRHVWKRPVKGKLPALHQLNLANNLIFSLSPTDLQVAPSLQTLDVSNNPLQCNQDLRDSIIWLNKHAVSPASAWPVWTTHQPVYILNFSKLAHSVKISSWKDLAKQRCSDKQIIESEEEVLASSTDDPLSDEYDDIYEYFDSDEDASRYTHKEQNQQFVEDEGIDIAELALESTRFRNQNRSHYSFLWPTLVFIFTALSVLVIAANIMLLMLRSKMLPRHVNIPHIKIPQWSGNGKLKKHSGSVYQALSEEKCEPYIPTITRIEPVRAHGNTSKSVV